MDIKTSQEVNTLIDSIDALLTDIYKVGDNSIKQTLSKYPNISNEIQSENLNLDNTEELKERLLALRLQLKNLERLQVTLPFNPSVAFLGRLVDWFRNSVKEHEHSKLVLDIDVKPEMLAGMTIGYRGKYKDYSAKSSIDKYFSNYRSLHELLS